MLNTLSCVISSLAYTVMQVMLAHVSIFIYFLLESVLWFAHICVPEWNERGRKCATAAETSVALFWRFPARSGISGMLYDLVGKQNCCTSLKRRVNRLNMYIKWSYKISNECSYKFECL